MGTEAALSSLDEASWSPSLPQPEMRPVTYFSSSSSSSSSGRQAGHTMFSWQESDSGDLSLMIAMSFSAKFTSSRCDSKSLGCLLKGWKVILGEEILQVKLLLNLQFIIWMDDELLNLHSNFIPVHWRGRGQNLMVAKTHQKILRTFTKDLI